MQTFLFRVILSFVGGFVATGPMTMAMLALHKKLPAGQRHPLPPREITDRITRGMGVRHKLSQDGMATLTLLNHFGYGGMAGIGYALLTNTTPKQVVVRGPFYGFLVWALSYLGLLPTLGILKPANRHGSERNALMIAVHLVWGVILAGFVAMLMEDRRAKQGILLSPSASAHRDTSS